MGNKNKTCYILQEFQNSNIGYCFERAQLSSKGPVGGLKMSKKANYTFNSSGLGLINHQIGNLLKKKDCPKTRQYAFDLNDQAFI